MPELPDVEVFRQYMEHKALNQPIEQVQILAEEILEGTTAKRLKSHLEGREFESTARHGKHLFVKVSRNGWLVFHFGMTGRLDYFKGSQAPEYSRAIFTFTNGYSLAFLLQRKLGRLALTESTVEYRKKHGLGPDVMNKNFSLSDFSNSLKETNSTVKSTLMNQELMAGIGNIYSDEILFQARLHPKIMTAELDQRQIDKLYHALREVLQTAIDSQADPSKMPDHFLIPQRKNSCPVCGADVGKTTVSGRSAYFCPKCQKKRPS